MDDVTRPPPSGDIDALRATRFARLVRAASLLIEGGSGEYILKRHDVSNGGTVVLLRALHSTLLIVVLGLCVKNVFDANRTLEFSWRELGAQISEIPPWFATVFAATYAALYTRFASQWTYLAGVYNQIKAAECRGEAESSVIAEWKAGFIEDASDLHLLRKKMFASVVKAWGAKEEVRQAFSESSYGGAVRFEQLMAQARSACTALHNHA